MADIEQIRQDQFRDLDDSDLACKFANISLIGTFSCEQKYHGFTEGVLTLLTAFKDETIESPSERQLLAEVLGRIVERNGSLAQLGEIHG